MNFPLDEVLLRALEPRDLDALYQQKNDPEVAALLGGFSSGYCRADLAEWLERHRKRQDEILWAIADARSDRCLGHAGFYRIDHRVRAAEYAIMLGAKDCWGRGLGTAVSRCLVAYGFEALNLNRIALSVLAHNDRARRLYAGLGFREEGVLRQAQFKGGQYCDLVPMAMLREEYDARPR
jgi:RimJ/RimL family protein N-acetyltransferase